MKKLFSIISLSLIIIGLSPPSNAALPWIIIQGWTTAVNTTPDPKPVVAVHVVPAFTPSEPWATIGDTKPSDIADTAHPDHTAKQIDLVFDYLEGKYTDYFPSHQKSYYSQGYRVRYYPSNEGYLYVHTGKVRFSIDIGDMEVKTLDQWLKLSGVTASGAVPTDSRIDALYDWFEDHYPHLFPSKQESFFWLDGYRTRYYPSTDIHLASKGDYVHFSGRFKEMGSNSLDYWLKFAGIVTLPVTDGRALEVKDDTVPTRIHIDLLYDWFEENYPHFFPSNQESFLWFDEYRTRYYPSTDIHLASKGAYVHFSGRWKEMGSSSLDYWLKFAGILAATDIKDSVFPVTRGNMATNRQISLLYDWFEDNYPQYFPSYQTSYEWLDGYWTRYYPSTDIHLASKGAYVHFSGRWKEMGSNSLDYWLELSGVAAQEEDRLIDLLFNWMEKEYPHYLPSNQESYDNGEIRTRYYPSDDSYLFVENGSVHLHRYDGNQKEVFSLEFWLDYSGIAADEKRQAVLRQEKYRKHLERYGEDYYEAARQEASREGVERIEAARIEAKRLEAERLEVERVEAERLEVERVEAERVEAERVEAERVEAGRVEAARLEAERQACRGCTVRG